MLENNAGKILLTIGNRQLSADSSLPFEPGQVLNLQVLSVGRQPVLRVVAALQESATAMAVRMLLPRHGPTTPLLASLSQLTASPDVRLPPAVDAAARALVRNLPDVAALSTPVGVRTAVRNSGTFLEHHLAPAAGTGTSVAVSFDSDFKVNLLRLLQLVRNWPGGNQTAQLPQANGPNPGRRPRARRHPPARHHLRSLPPAARPPGLRPRQQPTRLKAHPGAASAQSSPAAQPQTLQRAIEAAATALPPRATAAPSSVTPPATSATTTLPASEPAAGTVSPAPPFAGVVPTPQTPVQATVDLLNRFGHLRLDLLQQTEAALGRIHLNQLASLPREAEHRLVEWLFDIPVRRGDTIDLWSARVYRDSDDESQQRDRPTVQWRVQLAFDLPGLAPMQAQISLQGESVATRFWATEASTLPLLREHLHDCAATCWSPASRSATSIVSKVQFLARRVSRSIR